MVGFSILRISEVNEVKEITLASPLGLALVTHNMLNLISMEETKLHFYDT